MSGDCWCFQTSRAAATVTYQIVDTEEHKSKAKFLPETAQGC